MQNKVTSLELSKKLVELGIVLETAFRWRVVYKNKDLHGIFLEKSLEEKLDNVYDLFDSKYTVEYYPAPLACELAENMSWFVNIRKWAEYRIRYKDEQEIADEILANALSKMLIKLKEEGLLTGINDTNVTPV